MKIPLLFTIALTSLILCACNGSGSTPANPSAPVTPIANSTVTPYQQPTANKLAAASPTPCVGTYLVPGANGAPDEIHPCSDQDANTLRGNANNKLVNTARPANTNKAGKNKTLSTPGAMDSIEDN